MALASVQMLLHLISSIAEDLPLTTTSLSPQVTCTFRDPPILPHTHNTTFHTPAISHHDLRNNRLQHDRQPDCQQCYNSHRHIAARDPPRNVGSHVILRSYPLPTCVQEVDHLSTWQQSNIARVPLFANFSPIRLGATKYL